jgi:hypothetical protein
VLSITVQAHPHRREMVETLARRIGCGINWDPTPEERPSAWRTYRHALETAPPDATHRLIVQDDAAVCQHFEQAAQSAVAATQPGSLLCLFVPGALHAHTSAIDAACMSDRTIALLPPGSWVPVVATCWPTEAIPAALEWVDAQGWPEGFNADDEIVGRLTRALALPVHATVPSLVDHPDDVVSIVGSRTPMFGANRDRVAHCYVGDDADPRSITWAT